jgi:hypothetical protein
VSAVQDVLLRADDLLEKVDRRPWAIGRPSPSTSGSQPRRARSQSITVGPSHAEGLASHRDLRQRRQASGDLDGYGTPYGSVVGNRAGEEQVVEHEEIAVKDAPQPASR